MLLPREGSKPRRAPRYGFFGLSLGFGGAGGVKAGIFAPLEYRHRYLVDGGVVDFLPVEAARQLGAEWVLASSAENAAGEMPENVLSALMQVIDIRGSMLARAQEKEADFLIKSMVQGIKVADFNKCVEAGEAGVAEVALRLDGAKESLLVYAAPRLLGGGGAK